MEQDLIKLNESVPLPLTPYEHPSSFKWKLLDVYLNKFKDVIYYKAVCKRIIVLGYAVPANIINSFKKVNSNALLDILVSHGILDDATDLVIDYIDALLNYNGKQSDFDIKVRFLV
jgi:hypothetical protein